MSDTVEFASMKILGTYRKTEFLTLSVLALFDVMVGYERIRAVSVPRDGSFDAASFHWGLSGLVA